MSEKPHYASICAQVNAELRVPQVIEFIGWHPERLVKFDDVYLALCPIHGDKVFRTLVLNPHGNTYQCRHVNCPGNSPSDLIDLVAQAFNETMPEALARLVEHFGAEAFGLNEYELEVLEEVLEDVQRKKAQRDE